MDAPQHLPLVILDLDVQSTRFACDLARCKGACCTMEGGVGAPVTAAEVGEIARVLPQVLPRLGDRARREIERRGFIDTEHGALRCIDDRDCVFVFREDGVAKCAIERAFHDGDSEFRKPLSCHLFPLRRSEGIYDHLRVERIPECAAGFERGAREKIPLLASAKDALVRAFGDAWVAHLAATEVPE